eukprot:357002-Chlamydomonas_euryale.AAC.5
MLHSTPAVPTFAPFPSTPTALFLALNCLHTRTPPPNCPCPLCTPTHAQPDAPAWIPETYVLSQGDPKGAAAFKRAYERHARAGTGTTWIVKPTSCNRGNGIEIFNAAAAVLAHVGSRRPGSRSIVQKYIDAPLLVGGRKFDLRAYVLVTPGREVFLHREAYVRTCATPYSLSDVSNK